MHTRLLTTLAIVVAAVCTMNAQAPIPIAQAKQQAFGTVVTKVAGRVTSAGIFRNTAYFQDGTAGIAVFNNAFRLGVQVGDSVVVENATLGEFGFSTGAPGTGLTQLLGDGLTFTVIPVAKFEPAPKNITIPNIGESVEGQLVRIRRVKFLQSGSFQGETTYQIQDLSGNDIDVRIDGGTEIASNFLAIPTGEIDIIGLLGQFRGTFQITPRFATDLSQAPIVEDTVAKSRTLDITTWNLEWFGETDTSRGPSDKARQNAGIRRVMDSIAADLYALQEIVSNDTLMSLASKLVGNYSSLYATDITSDQRLAYIYNRDVVTPISNGLAVNGGSQAWANGRYPYRITFDATVEGVTRRIVVFNIHGKATDSATAMEDYNRRKVDAETFHAYLRDFYADSLVLVVGDFNDDIRKSVIDTTLPSPYRAFLDDVAAWTCATCPLAERGLSTYLFGTGPRFIDNILVSNEVTPLLYRTYMENPQAYLSSYSSTVSDHLPVTTRLAIAGAVSVEGEAPSNGSIGLRVSSNPMSSEGTAELTLEAPTNISVRLIDLTGNVTHTLLSGVYGPEIRYLSIPVNSVPAGYYVLQVMTRGAILTTPVIVTR